MLTSLTLQNYALIEHHELSLSSGFNVITGETGAGKSLILDALSLCIGGRADTGMVRHGTQNANIYAQFDHGPTGVDHNAHKDPITLSTNSLNLNTDAVAQWFADHEREFEGDILIRRQLSSTGRSKAWLNGVPVSLAELKELGPLLVNIHSQHAQQALLKPVFVVEWLDNMIGSKTLAKDTTTAYQDYQLLKRQACDQETKEAHRRTQIELLENQLADIAPLLAVDYAQIEAEHDELSNLEALMVEATQAVQLLDNETDDPDVMGLLGRAIRACQNQATVSQTFAQVGETLFVAQQQVSEAVGLLADYAEQQLPDPERLEELNALMSIGHRLSRKHGLPAKDLVVEAKAWQQELDTLLSLPTSAALERQMSEAWDSYVGIATTLSEKRRSHADAVSKKLVSQLMPLALPNARCEFVFNTRPEKQFNAQGIDDIELMFSANVGMPLQPLYKIASGGELSRMALVMQVLLATDHTCQPDTDLTDIAPSPSEASGNDNKGVADTALPMLVFDEVDVGISGGTAQVVGELLRQLGQHRQLLAITHQAQVAAQAHQHILVHKHQDTDEEQTTSQITVLTGAQQIDELARMSGGVNITDVTREHARSLLADVSK